VLILLSLDAIYEATALPSCPGRNWCVARKSAYWKSLNTFSSQPAEYFVCRFAKSARIDCGAGWNGCIGWYVGKKQEWNADRDFLSAGLTGYNKRDCNANHCNSQCSKYDNSK